MSGVGFLLAFFVLCIAGSLIVVARHRRPKNFMHSLDEFQREMDALSRPPQPKSPPRPVRSINERTPRSR